MATTYEKIRTKDGLVVILKNAKEKQWCGMDVLSGVKVNREGYELFERYQDGEVVAIKELVIVRIDEIKWRKPMLMSNHYGELVYMNGKP